MKEIPLTSLSYYEFTADQNLTESIFKEVLALDKEKGIGWIPTNNSIEDATCHGYLQDGSSYYNENLFNWFDSCVNQVSEKVFKNQEIKLSICDSWLTKTKFMHKANNHYHRFSVLSGVFYFQKFDKSKLKFSFLNLLQQDYIKFLGISSSDKTKNQEVTVSPEQGKLIIFPSSIYHSILPNSDKETRYSLAFNTFFSGVVGESPAAKLKIQIK